MKKGISKILLFIGVVLTIVSCTKNEITIVENVTVKFKCNSLLTVSESIFRSGDDYTHPFPTSYKAYFVSNENKGQYIQNQLVTTLDVNPGENTITIPKLKYTVYVTNYQKDGNWYTYNNASEQLPQASTILYLYGKNDINYSINETGEVTLVNYYAASMVKKTRWVTGIPKYNGTYYLNPENVNWYILYIRPDSNGKNNTEVPVTIAGYNTNSIWIQSKIEANKIYKYTIDASVPSTDGNNNFTVTVAPFGETSETTIKPY
jgi:hypothetical protein